MANGNFLTQATPAQHAKFAADAKKAGHTTVQFLKKKNGAKKRRKMTAAQAAAVAKMMKARASKKTEIESPAEDAMAGEEQE